MSFHHPSVLNGSIYPAYAGAYEHNETLYQNFIPRSYTEEEILKFELDLPEHRRLLLSVLPDVSDLFLPTERPPLPTACSSALVSPTYIDNSNHRQWPPQGFLSQRQPAVHRPAQDEFWMHQPQATPQNPSRADNPRVPNSLVYGSNHNAHQPAHGPPLQPPAQPATAPREISSHGLGIGAAFVPATASSPFANGLPTTARGCHRQRRSTTIPRSGLQYGEPEQNHTIMSHRPLTGGYMSSGRPPVELQTYRNEEHGRSQPARGPADPSQVNISRPQPTVLKEVALRQRQPQLPGKALRWKFYEPPSAESQPPSAPSPPTTSTTTSTTTSASEGGRSPSEARSSPPTSPEPPTPSPPVYSASPASAPSASATSSSSSQRSAKRKRQNDEPIASSSTPRKKSKKACKDKPQGQPKKQAAKRTQSGLRLRHVMEDPSRPKPEDEFRGCTGQERIRKWLEKVEGKVEVEEEFEEGEGEGDGLGM